MSERASVQQDEATEETADDEQAPVTTGAQSVIRALENAGAEYVFGVQGGAIMPVYDALYDSDIDHVTMAHEQGASHAADAFGIVSGEPGVCFATSGPGATNLVTGLADANMDSDPVIALTGQVPTSFVGNDAFQETDTVGITQPVTKHSYFADDADTVGTEVGGEQSPLFDRLRYHDRPRPACPEGLEEQQADRTGTDDDDGGARLQVGLIDAPDATSQWFGERCRGVREIADVFEATRRRHHVLRKGAVEDFVARTPDRGPVLTEVLSPVFTEATLAAELPRKDGDAVSGRDVGHRITDGDDVAGTFVARHDREVRGERAVIEVVVGHTDATGTDSDHRLVRAGCRALAFHDRYLAVISQDSGFHRTSNESDPSGK